MYKMPESGDALAKGGSIMKKKYGKKWVVLMLVFCLVFTMTACGKNADSNTNSGNVTGGGNVDDTVSIDTIYEAIKEAYGDDYLPNMMLSEDEILSMFGIEPEWCDELIAEIPMISTNVDTLIAIKAREGFVEDVINAVTAYQDYLKNDSFQYPMNMDKVAASTVVTFDRYVFFIMLGTLDDDVDTSDDAARLAAFEAKNQIAVDVIEGFLLK